MRTVLCALDKSRAEPQKKKKLHRDGFISINMWQNYCVPQFANMEVTVTFIKDELGSNIPGFLKREELLGLSVCTAAFILGIPHVTKVQNGKVILFFLGKVFPWMTVERSCFSSQGGIYTFQLMDAYTAVLSVVFLAFCEIVAVCWIFGKILWRSRWPINLG